MRKFLLEKGLDKLAGWLRLLGQDALVLNSEVRKAELLRHLDRTFITTSRKLETHLKAWGVDYLVLPKERWEVQLYLLLKHFRIKPELKLNRCYYCNAQLLRVKKEEVEDRLPPLVRTYGKDFTLCPTCGKVYWKGTHHEKLKKKLRYITSISRSLEWFAL